MQLPRERAQFRLASLDDPTGQVPHVRVGTLVRAPMHEKDSIFTYQRADDDPVHSSTRAWTSDKPTSAHAALRLRPTMPRPARRSCAGTGAHPARLSAAG